MGDGADDLGMNTDRRETDRGGIIRRLFRRVDVGIQAVTVRAPAGSTEELTALKSPTVIDISATGACLQLQESDVGVTDELVLDFVLDDVHYQAAGAVVWVQLLPGIHATRLGLKFQGMAEAQKGQLARHLVMRKHRLPTRRSSGARTARS
jgi:hypothetical protein